MKIGMLLKVLGWGVVGAWLAEWGVVVMLLYGWFGPPALAEAARTDHWALFYVMAAVAISWIYGMVGLLTRSMWLAAETSLTRAIGVGCGLALGGMTFLGLYAYGVHVAEESGWIFAGGITGYFLCLAAEGVYCGWKEEAEPLRFVGAPGFNFMVILVLLLLGTELSLPFPDGNLSPEPNASFTLAEVHGLSVLLFAWLGIERYLLLRYRQRAVRFPASGLDQGL